MISSSLLAALMSTPVYIGPPPREVFTALPYREERTAAGTVFRFALQTSSETEGRVSSKLDDVTVSFVLEGCPTDADLTAEVSGVREGVVDLQTMALGPAKYVDDHGKPAETGKWVSGDIELNSRAARAWRVKQRVVLHSADARCRAELTILPEQIRSLSAWKRDYARQIRAAQ